MDKRKKNILKDQILLPPPPCHLLLFYPFSITTAVWLLELCVSCSLSPCSVRCPLSYSWAVIRRCGWLKRVRRGPGVVHHLVWCSMLTGWCQSQWATQLGGVAVSPLCVRHSLLLCSVKNIKKKNIWLQITQPPPGHEDGDISVRAAGLIFFFF